jgi:hypothetical protein
MYDNIKHILLISSNLVTPSNNTIHIHNKQYKQHHIMIPHQRKFTSNVSSGVQFSKKRKKKHIPFQNGSSYLERMILGFVCLIAVIIAGSLVYQVSVLKSVDSSYSHTSGHVQSETKHRFNRLRRHDSLPKHQPPHTNQEPKIMNMNQSREKEFTAANPSLDSKPKQSTMMVQVKRNEPYLYPPFPILPIFSIVDNASSLIQDVLNGNPTMAGIIALLQTYMSELHNENMRLADSHAEPQDILNMFYTLASKHIVPFDKVYRNKSIFPIREDESIFMSLAAFREHLLMDTMKYAFDNAKYPDKLFIGAVVQNCFGKVLPDGTIDPSGTPCKTGRQVIGKDKHGHDQTKVSDAPIDVNGIEEFCTNVQYKKYCEAGQIRVLYVHESESLGPAMARYHASKLWGGETYFVQTDSHLQFAVEWDEKYRNEIKATKAYPKSVLSSYPPGFEPGNGNSVRESDGARLCTCMTNMQDPNPIIRINTGVGYHGNEPRPTQIPFIAAGFFFAHASFLVDVPFDPFIPWCFMGEEIALSMRAWTHGWTIYAPRKNLIAHQYRPGRMGLPKFWGSVGRTFGRPGPGLNTKLQGPVLKRIKHLVGYTDATLEKIRENHEEFVLQDLDYYGLGTANSRDEYLAFAGITVDEKNDSLQCHHIQWCNNGEYE